MMNDKNMNVNSTNQEVDYDMVEEGPPYLNHGWAHLAEKLSPPIKSSLKPENILEFDFCRHHYSMTDNIRSLQIRVSQFGDVLLCPKLNGVYTWWRPSTSPGDGLGGWSKLKHIEGKDCKQVSLWGRAAAYESVGSLRNHRDISEIAEHQMECYLIPMDDVVYSYWDDDGLNFNIYVKHEGTYYYYTMSNDVTEFHQMASAHGKLYHLKDNSIALLGEAEMSPPPIELHPEQPEQPEANDPLTNTPSVRSESGREEAVRKNVSFIESRMVKLRQDPYDGQWYTKDEFYEYYHSDRIWEMQHPLDIHLRNEIREIIEYAQTKDLSDSKTRLLLQSIMRTY